MVQGHARGADDGHLHGSAPSSPNRAGFGSSSIATSPGRPDAAAAAAGRADPVGPGVFTPAGPGRAAGAFDEPASADTIRIEEVVPSQLLAPHMQVLRGAAVEQLAGLGAVPMGGAPGSPAAAGGGGGGGLSTMAAPTDTIAGYHQALLSTMSGTRVDGVPGVGVSAGGDGGSGAHIPGGAGAGGGSPSRGRPDRVASKEISLLARRRDTDPNESSDAKEKEKWCLDRIDYSRLYIYREMAYGAIEMCLLRAKTYAAQFRGLGRRGRLQYRCFLLTFAAYACTLALRTPLGVIRHAIIDDLGVPVEHTGWMDTALLLPLGVIQVVASGFKFKYDPRQLLCGTVIGAAIAMLLFGLWHAYGVLLVCLFLSGALQALVFPQCIQALGLWYSDPNRRTTVFGMWGLSAALGGMVGKSQATAVMSWLGWHQAFIMPGFAAILVGLAMLRFLRLPTGATAVDRAVEPAKLQTMADGAVAPSHELEVLMSGQTYREGDAQWREGDDAPGPDAVHVIDSVSVASHTTFAELWRIPMLKEFAATYFCINVLRYAVLMWLPIYLQDQLGFSKYLAGWVSLAYDGGALLGGPGLALVTDFLLGGRKIHAVQLGLVVSSAALFLFYVTLRWGRFFNVMMLLISGLASGGTDMVLTGSIAVDLGTSGGRRKNCIAGVAGTINGCGVLGAVAQGPLVAFMLRLTGEQGTSWLITTFALLPILVINRAAQHDRKKGRLPGLSRARDYSRIVPD